MKKVGVLSVMFGMILVLPLGCRESPKKALKVVEALRTAHEFRKMYSPQPYEDVTASTEYNFSSFAGTLCKTKVNVALADGKTYTGVFEPCLLAPIHYDPREPEYTSGTETHIISVLPPVTRFRIERLMKDQGVAGFVQVEAILLDGTNAQKAVYLDPVLLADNKWSGRKQFSITNWGISPEMLEEE